jgi:hypothetical protein
LMETIEAVESLDPNVYGVLPDGHPKSPTCGHLKIPH